MITSYFKNITKYSYLKGVEVLSSLTKLFVRKIDPSLLIFGGNTFAGNTKYLFLYLNKNLGERYKVLWISGNKNIVNDLKELGYYSKYKFSLKVLLLLLKARCVFITHGFNDILPVKLNKDTKLVYLAHGIPFKRPNFDAKNYYTIFKGKYDLEMIQKLFKRMDYHISCSDNFNKILANAYNIGEDKVVTTGYPRNDILFKDDEDYRASLKQKFNIPMKKKMILYAPTFREERDLKFPLGLKEIAQLEDFLDKSNSILILKPHINEKIINLKGIKNVRIISQQVDIQELLVIADALITDYSSVFLDFILSNRPMLFFAYDLDYYRNTRGNFYFKYEDFVPGPLASNGYEFISNLQIIYNNEYIDKIKEIRNFSHQYIDGNSCKRICELLEL